MTAPQAPGFTRTDFAGGSWQSRLVSFTMRLTIKNFLRFWARTQFLPWPGGGLIDHVGRLLPRVDGITHRGIQLPQCRAEIVSPVAPASDRFVVYLHGGAFYIGGRYLHRNLIGKFADALSSQILHVGYRKMPRHPISDAIDDCLDGYRYALALGVDPSRIILMGDSAGGYLTFTTALGIREAGLPMPAAIVAISPLTDWDHSAKSAAASAGTCAVFPRSTPAALTKLVTRCNPGSELISPARCDLTGLPPTLIQAATSEFPYPDAVLMAEKLAAHGVKCELQLWDGQVHVFHAAAGFVPEATQAVAEAIRFLNRAVPATVDHVA
ncbi:hypothetical protein A5721_13895 [Mycobacterium vulneris]|nr:hypothetical protein A5721_13895 [Mycolicibacterium vulneris]